jgi:hypothetical protein
MMLGETFFVGILWERVHFQVVKTLNDILVISTVSNI